MKQKLILTLLLLLLAAHSATAQEFELDGIYYEIIDNYDDGEGFYLELDHDIAVVTSCDTDGNIIIPGTVTYEGVTYSVEIIGSGAFEYCSDITSVVIPNSVTSICSNAFCYCTSLTSVTIPNSVTYIGYGAFRECI